MTNKTCQLKSEKCSGEELSKVWITDMAAVNAVGNKIPMFVIRKAQNPCCFKNVKFLPCGYRHQKKLDGWVLSEERVRELDQKFLSAGRIVALVIDDCPAHPTQPTFQRWIKLFQGCGSTLK